MQFLYSRLVLRYPRIVLALIGLLMAVLAYHAAHLQVDASAETLVLENDEDLRFTREVDQRYHTPEFLVITYTPTGDLLADDTLANIRRLKGELEHVAGVASVVSLLDVPLMESPPRPLKELLADVPSLETPGIDRALARQELLSSPIYRDMLVSRDFATTAIQVNLVEDEAARAFLKQREGLREKERSGTLNEQDSAELAALEADFRRHRDDQRQRQHETIAEVRAVMAGYRDGAELFLGGVPMIADDLITFVKSDLRVFGLGVMVFLIVTLWIIFRQMRWIVLPLLTCGFSVLATAGLLGMFDWEVTVISSNFISLQLIITMAMTIHLIVRYREAITKRPEAEQKDLVLETVLAIGMPCLYMALTTVAGFSSLLLSGILPVINFGWMMSSGVVVSLLLTFLIFPAVLVQLPKLGPNTVFESRFGLTRKLAAFTERFGRTILGAAVVLLLVCVAGAVQLRVENSFISYFRPSTEIYQGMLVIDRQLGGTTPLDVVLNFDAPQQAGADVAAAPAAGSRTADAAAEKDSAEFEGFEEEFKAGQGEAQYWFTAEKMAEVERVHDYLDGLSGTGKVLSLGTMLKVGRTLNGGDPLDNFALALIYNELPAQFRTVILDPYVSVQDNQVRFSVLVRDSEPNLRRNQLLKQINYDLEHKLGLAPERYRLTGILVLYNNMLQSLFNSQILTLGAVVGALLLMFLVLFRSVKIALVAIAPNVLSVGFVLGLMGWADIPLDLMTITIAAISVGIAVDNTIHYIHRFRTEFAIDRDYVAAMHRSHGSIGYAMYYTSVTVVIGFSILVLSNFIPSIYFGLLTGLVMVIALIAALTLLPRLILMTKPLGPGAEPTVTG